MHLIKPCRAQFCLLRESFYKTTSLLDLLSSIDATMCYYRKHRSGTEYNRQVQMFVKSKHTHTSRQLYGFQQGSVNSSFHVLMANQRPCYHCHCMLAKRLFNLRMPDSCYLAKHDFGLESNSFFIL